MKIELDPDQLHDRRMCLALGQNPEKPTMGDVSSIHPDLSGMTTGFFIATALGRDNRRLEATFKETMSEIWQLCDKCLSYGINPLPGLRVYFPEWKWTHLYWEFDFPEQELPPEEIEELRGANYVWCVNGYNLVIASGDSSNRFYIETGNEDFAAEMILGKYLFERKFEFVSAG